MLTETKIVARYAETDKMGIIHHSIYPVWYEVARTDFIKAFGISYSKLEDMGLMMPLVNLSCHYSFPVKYEDEIIIRTGITKISCGKISFEYKAYIQPEDKLIGYGSTEHGFVDSKTFKPINAKKFAPELFESLKNSIEE